MKMFKNITHLSVVGKEVADVIKSVDVYERDFRMIRSISSSFKSMLREAFEDAGHLHIFDICPPSLYPSLRSMIIYHTNKLMVKNKLDHGYTNAERRALLDYELKAHPTQSRILGNRKQAVEFSCSYKYDIDSKIQAAGSLESALECAPFNPYQEINNMKVTRPVMVGSTNILEASDDKLVSLIRQSEEQIKVDSDMAKLSTKFQKKAEELREVIALCLVQLDGDKKS